MTSILLVEDNAPLAQGLRSNLEFEGYEVAVAATAREALEAVAGDRRTSPNGIAFDLIVLDLMLPDGDGYRVLRALRESGHGTPVLILTALGEEADKVRGFRFGADDYVTKPFGLLELLARVDALLRRSRRAAHNADEAVTFGDVRVDLRARQVTRRGRPVALRPKEFELFQALVRREGKVATRNELLREVWGYDPAVVSRTVDTHIAELRRKLERDASHPEHIVTVLKTGYRFTRRPEPSAPSAMSDES